jgi:Phosphorylase superfamily
MTTVILCGMPDEKRVLTEALPGTLILSGTDKLNLQKLVPADCNMIVSAGLCGGMAPGLGIAAMVVASLVVDKAGQHNHPDAIWNNAVIEAGMAAGIGISPRPYYSSGLEEADTIQQRAALYRKYGACAIDDETRFAAAFAVDRGISFGVFRSVSDDWSETLPIEARGAIMNADGSPNLDYLAKTMKVTDIPMLLKIAGDYAASLNALQRTAFVCRAAILR